MKITASQSANCCPALHLSTLHCRMSFSYRYYGRGESLIATMVKDSRDNVPAMTDTLGYNCSQRSTLQYTLTCDTDGCQLTTVNSHSSKNDAVKCEGYFCRIPSSVHLVLVIAGGSLQCCISWSMERWLRDRWSNVLRTIPRNSA